MFNFCQFPFGQKRKNILLRRWRFECLREANYREFCHPKGRSRGPSKQLQAIQHGEFSREHYVVVFSRISFSWVIYPLFALTWTSRDFLWIQNCRNGSFC